MVQYFIYKIQNFQKNTLEYKIKNIYCIQNKKIKILFINFIIF